MRSRIILFQLFATCIFCWPNFIEAQHNSSPPKSAAIQIDLTLSFTPHSAVGLIFSNNKTTEKLDAKIEKDLRGNFIVSIPYEPTELQGPSFASAIILSENGEAAFTTVKEINNNVLDSAFGSIPECKNDKVGSIAVVGQLALIEQLVEVRSKLKAVGAAKLSKALSGDFLLKLRKLEKSFGLARDKELDPSLPVFELLDRLNRLQHALKSWNDRPKELNTASPAATLTTTESIENEQQSGE